jgi:hypothetical protein
MAASNSTCLHIILDAEEEYNIICRYLMLDAFISLYSSLRHPILYGFQFCALDLAVIDVP